MAQVLTEIDRVNSKNPKTLGTGFLAILARAIHLVARATFDEPKFTRKEYFIAFPGIFEPFTYELFTVSIEADLGSALS